MSEEGQVADWTNATVEVFFMHFHDWTYEQTGRWGGAQKRWQGDLGSVLLVRHDRQPLSIQDVSNLYAYCQEEILPLREQEGGFDEATTRATPDEFQEWVDCRKEQGNQT